jgi:hypothetical protein
MVTKSLEQYATELITVATVLSGVMLNITMLNAVMLNFIMLSVTAPNYPLKVNKTSDNNKTGS